MYASGSPLEIHVVVLILAFALLIMCPDSSRAGLCEVEQKERMERGEENENEMGGAGGERKPFEIFGFKRKGCNPKLVSYFTEWC